MLCGKTEQRHLHLGGGAGVLKMHTTGALPQLGGELLHTRVASHARHGLEVVHLARGGAIEMAIQVVAVHVDEHHVVIALDGGGLLKQQFEFVNRHHRIVARHPKAVDDGRAHILRHGIVHHERQRHGGAILGKGATLAHQHLRVERAQAALDGKQQQAQETIFLTCHGKPPLGGEQLEHIVIIALHATLRHQASVGTQLHALAIDIQGQGQRRLVAVDGHQTAHLRGVVVAVIGELYLTTRQLDD